MSRRETTKLETRQLILEAARKLFHTKGPEQCTMRDIAREAGVSPASVVVHFKNKTALLEVALYEDIEKAIAGAVATMPQDACLHDRLMHIAQCMYGFYDNDRELYRVLIRDTTFEKAGQNPYLTKQLEDYLQFFGAMIEQEKLLGTVRFDADARIAASSLFSLYFSVLMEFLRNPNMPLNMALEWLAASAHQHLTGILTSKEGKGK
ncbi:MAG: TetR/AcrR family transcriptional regulator [Proteobacteria bacterium]|nr:TetR/AcrR family transcriptional regulator [Pseudomonadota bacterium]MBU0968014.1 TetR/AcrR family transcriptional regulator [Pseudomonadota bacterium]